MVWGLLGSLPMLVAFPQAIRMFPRMAEQQRRHPGDRPHWYLWCVGVHPSFRRRGVASALARFVIDKADADGVGCYLETAGDGTEALYRRLGFDVRERWEIRPRRAAGSHDVARALVGQSGLDVASTAPPSRALAWPQKSQTRTCRERTCPGYRAIGAL